MKGEHQKESVKPGRPSKENPGNAQNIGDGKNDQQQDVPAVQGNGAGEVGQEDAFLASIALRQDYGETVGVEKVLITVPFRKPNKDEFFRVHPSPQHRPRRRPPPRRPLRRRPLRRRPQRAARPRPPREAHAR